MCTAFRKLITRLSFNIGRQALKAEKTIKPRKGTLGERTPFRIAAKRYSGSTTETLCQ
jgi:hypothetical protein